MSRLFLTALTIWALHFSGGGCGSAKVQPPQNRPAETKATPAETKATPAVQTIKLTHERPVDSFPVAPELRARAPKVLEVSVTRVSNPAMAALNLSAYFLPAAGEGGREPERILIGTVSLYPPDRGGKFLLDASAAFRKLPAAAEGSKPAALVLELQRLDETKAWTPVELTIEAPKWRGDEPEK